MRPNGKSFSIIDWQEGNVKQEVPHFPFFLNFNFVATAEGVLRPLAPGGRGDDVFIRWHICPAIGDVFLGILFGITGIFPKNCKIGLANIRWNPYHAPLTYQPSTSKKELNVKFLKGVAIFFVFCFAAYGVFTFLKRPPVLSVTQDEMDYLGTLGIGIQDGQASASGLSGVLSDVQGVPSIGSGTGASASSAPPSFLGGPAASSIAPSYSHAAPPYTERDSVQQPATEELFSPTIDVLPPPNLAEPVDFPIQTSTVDVPQFESSPPVPATESPPPWEQNWDGPASDLTAVPATTDYQHLLDISSSPTLPTQSPVSIKNLDPLGGGSVRRIEANTTRQANAFSTTNNTPVSPAPTRYTQTAARQSSLTFEPVRPEAASNDPVVAFTAPRRTYTPPPPPPQQQSESLQHPVAVVPATDPETPRRIEESPADTVSSTQSPIRDALERYLQSRGQLTESGDPEKIRIAFVQLSQLYEHDQLSEAERATMRPMLDALALKVIYSRDSHILEPPYQVKPGETVESIAHAFNLNAALLRKINGLTPSQGLTAGTTLKVVYGQFDARISVHRKELTLLLGGLYAGRFSFAVSNPEIPTHPGEFVVTYRTDRSMALNNSWILATAHTADATIVFSDQDAREIFDILSDQSVIVVE